jgi:hypothetical protein
VPEIWLDVDSMADLGDVASEFRARKPEHDGDARVEEIASRIRAAV